MKQKLTYEEQESRIKDLERNEAYYKLLIDHSVDMISKHDPEGNYTYSSPACFDLIGYTFNELIGRNAYDLFHPDDIEEIKKSHEQVVNSRVVYTVSYRIRHKQGHYVWVETVSTVITDPDSGEIKEIICTTRDISKRQQIEESLLLKEKIISSSAIAITIGDLDGNLIYGNPYFIDRWGFESPEDFVGKPFWNFWMVEEKLDQIMHTLKSGKPWEDENKAIRKDGSTFCVHVTAVAVFNDKGQPIALTSTSIDITDRIRAEQTLKEQTKTLNDIIEYAGDGICVCHNIPIAPFVKFTHWNPRMNQITGYSIEEINHLGWYQSMYPDPEAQKKAMERMARMRFGDDIISEDWVIITKNKTQKVLSISTSVIKKENDETYVMAVMQDVSEQRQYQDQLIASQKEWEGIFQAIGHPTIILDPQHGIVKANKSALNITGLSEKQLTGKKCFDIFHATTEPPQSCPMEALLHKGSLETVEMVMEAFNGTFLVSCTPIIDTNGNIEKIIHIATDITETKKLESHLRQALKMESIGTLTGGIAHDFNNIMGIILGNTELALEDVPEWNPGHTNLEEIKKASLRAANIVRQLLSFTRITNQKLQPMEIALVIKDALKFLRSTIPTTIDIEQNIFVTDETILADSTQINQIMMNLCINASHTMEQSGGKLTINVENVLLDDDSAKDYPDLKNGKYVNIMVSDTGPGIDPKIIDRIFDPYFTTKGIGKGSGMGLAVVHGIVKSHGGAIKVDSTLGKGTTFSILFPLVQETAAVEEETIQEIPRGNETILFVDDEISIVNMVQRMFERLGYKVQTATTPQDALDRFALNPDYFDLVITDMTMPQMTGVKLSEKLMDIRPDIPIIICTGYSALVDEEKAKELRLAAYVMKPINMRETAQTIRKILDKSNVLFKDNS